MGLLLYVALLIGLAAVAIVTWLVVSGKRPDPKFGFFINLLRNLPLETEESSTENE